MKTDEEIKTDVYRVIVGSELQRAITGKVSKRKRPHNSGNEDIVISVLANENGQIQTATVNVNIFVQDEYIDGQPEEKTIRIKELCKMAETLFDVFSGDGFRSRLLSQRVMENEGTAGQPVPEHVINNKIEYKFNNE